MARKLKSMERDFWFDLNPDNEASEFGTSFIDLAQVASLANRVSLRQGMEYVVESITLHTIGQANVAVFRLPEHWACLNAWEKAFRHWKEQQDDAAREAGLESTRAAWHDFKVFFNASHALAGTGSNLLPVGYVTSSGASATESYEWNPSQFVVPNAGATPGNTDECYGFMLGDSVGFDTRVGLIHEYGQSRSRPFAPDPNVPEVDAEDTLYGAMENVGDNMDEIIVNFQQHNHSPPYLLEERGSEEFYPGGANQGLWDLNGNYDGTLEGILSVNAGGASSNFAQTSMSGFVAPLGLLYIAHGYTGAQIPSPALPGTPGSCLLRITLAPGEYKGLMARTMQEAN